MMLGHDARKQQHYTNDGASKHHTASWRPRQTLPGIVVIGPEKWLLGIRVAAGGRFTVTAVFQARRAALQQLNALHSPKKKSACGLLQLSQEYGKGTLH
jgi:hypothetical protein